MDALAADNEVWLMLNMTANLVIIVILPMVIFMVKWINNLRHEIQTEVKAAHIRIGEAEKSHLQFQAIVSERYMTRETAHAIMDQQKTLLEANIDQQKKLLDSNMSQQKALLEAKLENYGEQLDRIEQWLTRINSARGKQ